MCDYQGYEFGAGYPDSVCINGSLFDADNCDNDGNLYKPAEDIPCPMCHPRLAVAYHASQYRLGGAAEPEALAAAKAIVADIRRNRADGTEPWKAVRR